MVSFHKLWERMQETSEDGGDSKAMQAIRTGINVREDFWDDFLKVINNASALSELLDVSEIKIGGWHSKVLDVLEKVHKADEVPEDGKNIRKKVLDTGSLKTF